MELAERLRIIGQWLDAHAAESAEVTVIEDTFWVECTDGGSALQRVDFPERELERLRCLAARARRSAFGGMGGRWGPGLRALGQLLEDQELRLLRLGASAGALWVVATYHGEFVQQRFPLTELWERDYCQRNRRVVQVLRQRASASPPWWKRLVSPSEGRPGFRPA